MKLLLKVVDPAYNRHEYIMDQALYQYFTTNLNKPFNVDLKEYPEIGQRQLERFLKHGIRKDDIEQYLKTRNRTVDFQFY